MFSSLYNSTRVLITLRAPGPVYLSIGFKIYIYSVTEYSNWEDLIQFSLIIDSRSWITSKEKRKKITVSRRCIPSADSSKPLTRIFIWIDYPDANLNSFFLLLERDLWFHPDRNWIYIIFFGPTPIIIWCFIPFLEDFFKYI